MEYQLGLKSLSNRIKSFCQEKRDKRKQEWEVHRVALEKMKESKGKQCHQQRQEERDTVYAQMLQNLERAPSAKPPPFLMKNID